MNQLLPVFIGIPLLGFLFSLFIPRRQEGIISSIVITAVGVHLAGILVFIVAWLFNGHPTLDIKHLILYKADDIEIAIDFYFDKVTAMFAFIGAFLTFLVAIYSRYYIHRDHGFKRFFNTIILFYSGYTILVFSGNYETLFIGWELLGVCTFVLVAFYRDRYLPVKNSLKVISIYRLGDICLILSMWMSHHLWHENISFLKLNDPTLINAHHLEHTATGIFVAIMIVVAAAVKSAQIPFSSWLPRAMEGPTTSSAIFYGSLSVHVGVFLLLRTYPYWESLMGVKVAIIVIGLATSIIAINIAKLQSALKAQIAYASIAQIGLIFIEVALGFHGLALIHFAGNAIFRTYQLLVSPSVQSYLIHDMFFSFSFIKKPDANAISKLKNTFYILSLKEWNMDRMLKSFFWDPFKWVGHKVSFLKSKVAQALLFAIFITGLYCYYFEQNVPVPVFDFAPYVLSFFGLLLILKAFAERGSALRAWGFVFSGQLFITLSVALHNEYFDHSEMSIYLSGSFISAIVGYICLVRMKGIDDNIDLDRFHGYVYEQPKKGIVFLLACLGMAGLPFTPTFIGIDLLFSHINKYEIVLLVFASIGIVFIELAVLRIYARIFMGQHKKLYHPIAYRSS